ncbi:RNA polymerase sigma factor [Pseudothauera nasutitermitis]|uniref:RNA polymerase sigma factor n=1 Tax=Pseudothauera nasutitermitis TaxID=2565930 RepID=UPI001B3B2747|nr:RNA polymerase sigma factor [Pseudothauera nasutitermitis]
MPSRYDQDLLIFCRRLVKDKETAAEIAQESYARALAAPQPIEKLGAFLRGVARNIANDLWRREQLTRSIFADPHKACSEEGEAAGREAAAPAHWQPEERAEARQRLARLRQALDSMPERQREAFLLYKFEELPHTEIAARMGISVRMVEKHVRLGLLHCKRSLQDAPDGSRRP